MEYKVVINTKSKGLNLSDQAILALKSFGIEEPKYLPRHNSKLIKVVTDLGDAASAEGSHLEVVPAGEYYHIEGNPTGENLIISPYVWIRIDEDNNN